MNERSQPENAGVCVCVYVRQAASCYQLGVYYDRTTC